MCLIICPDYGICNATLNLDLQAHGLFEITDSSEFSNFLVMTKLTNHFILQKPADIQQRIITWGPPPDHDDYNSLKEGILLGPYDADNKEHIAFIGRVVDYTMITCKSSRDDCCAVMDFTD
jgi:hypothetical protein